MTAKKVRGDVRVEVVEVEVGVGVDVVEVGGSCSSQKSS